MFTLCTHCLWNLGPIVIHSQRISVLSFVEFKLVKCMVMMHHIEFDIL